MAAPGTLKHSGDWREVKRLIKATEMASSLEYAKENGRTNDCLRCARCRGFEYDVGKIKEHPLLCLKCAYYMEDMLKGTELYNNIENTVKDYPLTKQLRSMDTTHKVDEFNVVYMPEEVFKEMYKDKLSEFSE